MIKETILSVYDNLTNPDRIEPINYPPKIIPFLGTKTALTWIQYELPEELTLPLLQLPTLQATFGLLGDIAEIFFFEPRPEGFIIFNGSVQIPNCGGILAPHHGLIKIKNPSHFSPPIRSALAPHYPTRRLAIGTLVTLPAYDQGQCEAMVIAIERNHWPKEWRYLIRIEETGKSPMLHTAILDRGTLNPPEIHTYIRPEVAILKDRDVAFLFNEFERPLRVTIIQPGNPGFHETVRMVQPLLQQLSPRMKLQEIESHRLFTAEMWPSYTDNLSEERALEPTSKSTIKWGPKIDWDLPLDIGRVTVMDQGPFLEGPPPRTDNWHLKSLKSGTAEIKTRSDTTDRVGGKQKLPPGEGGTVVIPKKKRCRGKQAGLQKILIRWRSIIIPCTFSALLTPATVITDIGHSGNAPIAALLKATLTPPDNPLATLQRGTPLSKQGIKAGDTLTLLVRHATIFDPYDNQHLVAYREDETIQHLLATLRDVSPIPLLSEIILCHNEFQLDHASRFQDCNLPHEPTLARHINQSGPFLRIQPAQSNSDADGLSEEQANNPSDVVREETVQQGQKEGDTVAKGQKTGILLSQVFLQDLEGKTHTLTFNPLDSIAKNLLIHSSHLQLPPRDLPPKWSIPKKKMAPRASVEGNPRSGAKLLNV